MAPQSTNAARLSLQDFRRLGLRPHEFRLVVIRRAAARRTRELAQRQLTTPCPRSGLQLARVATSTYRLLDPRQRDETSHRACVGRILPQMLSWASQTGFLHDLSEFGKSPRELGRAPFERSALSDAELIELLDLDSPPRQSLQTLPTWAASLDDVDLRHSRRRRWRASPWLWVAASGLLFGASLSFAVHRWASLGHDFAASTAAAPATAFSSPAFSRPMLPPEVGKVETSMTTAERSGATVRRPRPSSGLVPEELREFFASDPSERSAASLGQTASASTEAVASADLPDPGIQSQPPPMETDAILQVASDQVLKSGDPSLSTGVEARPSSNAGAEIHAEIHAGIHAGSRETAQAARPTASAISTASGSETEVDSLSEQSRPDIAGSVASHGFERQDAVSDPFLPDPFEPASNALPLADQHAAAASHGAAEDAAAQPQDEVASVGDRDSDIGPLHRVPSDAALSDARRHILALMPHFELAIESHGALLRIQQLELMGEHYSKGSPERWIVHALIAEAAWLIESVDQVEQRLDPLVQWYEVAPEHLLSSTFVQACRNATLPSTRSHMLDNGLRLADRLLIASSPEACIEVVKAIEPFTSALTDDSDEATGYLKNLSEAAELMTRYADVIDRAGDDQRINEADADHVEPGQKGSARGLEDAERAVLGRHYCLMQRRWDIGLRWLAESSDRRIAKAAQIELSLGADPTADELKAVADQWASVASRSTGRAAESMRLHAIDLLNQALEKASGLVLLEIERQIDQQGSSIPSHLLPLPPLGSDSATGARKRPASPSTGARLF